MSAAEVIWSDFEQRAMRRALELAERGLYSTDPNPRVGCVIARDEEIIAEGWHERAGEPHAEALALRAAGERAAGATAFVTLEPCAHFGRTPPCADALVAARVARVVFAVRDPNPKVNGSGASRLALGGIRVDSGLLAAEAEALNKGFLQRLRRGKPWLRLKQAMSLDGRVALASGESRWITGEAAREDVQRWRARSSCILTGVGTVIADDPALTVRIGPEPRRQPVRVVLDSALRTPPTARLLGEPGSTVIFTSAGSGDDAARLEHRGARIERVAGDERRLDLAVVVERLAALEVNELWVECGPALAGAWLDSGLIDEWFVYVAPMLLGADAQPLARIAPRASLAAAPRFEYREIVSFGPDLRITLRPAAE